MEAEQPRVIGSKAISCWYTLRYYHKRSYEENIPSVCLVQLLVIRNVEMNTSEDMWVDADA
jgi:hypothetical protein